LRIIDANRRPCQRDELSVLISAAPALLVGAWSRHRRFKII
jgi:hypothetical protein